MPIGKDGYENCTHVPVEITPLLSAFSPPIIASPPVLPQSPGGAVANMGGVMDFNGGSLFDDNSAFGDEGGDGGAIFSDEGGVIT